ncbi:GtrA family protein [Pedobacter sp. MR2016-24]|uniref:GtrA family protein n=1 Tax=Pedobacter sp. MR2016-24 TaxID=2994466 RepID=UPI002247BC16|nr:GtrA family protein [Pedobacter sp. MR2016-24]MCX2485933.1 GtrA family protein [Pedobacter sp. MR2016-24]
MINYYLNKIVVFFHTPFAGIIPLKTFRYGMSGGSNALLNLIVFYISYNYLFDRNLVSFAGFVITPYIAAYIVALCITFPVGFLLNKYFVFQGVKGQVSKQLSLYAGLTVANIFLEYVLLHLLIGRFDIPATLAQCFIIILLSGLSYLFQSYVTFRSSVS